MRRSTSVFILTLLLGGLLSIASPLGSQTTKQVGSCNADAEGNIPAENQECRAKIPPDTLPGEYTLRANGMAVPQGGSSYPAQEGDLTVAANRLCANEETAVSGGGFVPNSLVTLTLERAGALAAGRVGLSGAARAQEVIRTLTARITVPDCQNVAAASSETTETTPEGTGGGRPLSRTGVDVERWLLVAASFISLGLGCIVAGRRRVQSDDASI